MSAESVVFCYVRMFIVMALKFRVSSTTIIKVDLVKYVETLYTSSHVVVSQTSVTLFTFYTLMQVTDRVRGFCYASDGICVSFIKISLWEISRTVKD
jgi:hypothetical protein